MRKWLIRRWYAYRFKKVYRTLLYISKRHQDAGHEVYLNVVNEADIHLTCVKCPELVPLKRLPNEVRRVYRGSDGRLL